ncbi:hypothetical protein ACFWXA_37325, partial [Streptomyces atroolivaceus]
MVAQCTGTGDAGRFQAGDCDGKFVERASVLPNTPAKSAASPDTTNAAAGSSETYTRAPHRQGSRAVSTVSGSGNRASVRPRAGLSSPSGSIVAGGANPPIGTGTRREKGQISALAVGFPLLRLQESTNPCASAFDILQVDGRELLDEPLWRRREVLEALFADHRLTPPWTLCPSTT